MPPDSNVRPDQRDTTIAISATEIQTLLDGFTHTNAIFLGGLLCGLYLLLAIMHLALLPPILAKILVPLAAATALLFYVMRWVLKTKPTTIIFANHFATSQFVEKSLNSTAAVLWRKVSLVRDQYLLFHSTVKKM